MANNGATAWQAESLRVTLFRDPNLPTPDVKQWWADLTGLSGVSTSIRLPNDQSIDQGPFQGGHLSLTAQPGRFDWVLQPSPERNRILVLGSVEDVVSRFSTPVQSWLPKASPLSRIAFGPVFVNTATSVEDCYALLQTRLPFLKYIDVKGTSDFNYSINRPRASKTVSGATINRVSKWSVAQYQSLRVQITVGSQTQQTLQPITLGYAARAELDVNNVPGTAGFLPADHLAPLFTELVELAIAMVQKGDI
jgi:hypothetical protein